MSTINEDVQNNISDLISKLDILGEKTTEFKEIYEQYINDTLLDGTLLKNALKEKVIKVMNDDI